ncbi:MAG: RNA-binding S4 domain-containing protein [Oscillospiraceae bacterium]
MQKQEITTDFIKLDSFLKLCGLCQTGGGAKMAISEGLVFVNDEVCTMRGKKLYNKDKVSFEGEDFEVIKN